MKALIAVALVAFWIPQSKPSGQLRPRPKTASPMRVVVRDQSGNGIADVRVSMSGAAGKETITDASGNAAFAQLADGTYRFRFERDGFVMLEREVTVRNAQPSEIDIVLNPAPPPPPAPTPAAAPAGAVGPPGSPVTISIPSFLDKNFIGRDPLKESQLSCTGNVMTRLLQIRDGLAPHTHANMDEVLYIVGGDGTVVIGTASSAVTAGWLSVVPRGTSHAIERRGKNPIVVLSMLSGQPCQNEPAKSSGR
jgi:mannose-6-phosphate isomerase-like protein (cupin superfamily)